MKDILNALANGDISVEDAQRKIKIFAIHELEDQANLDIGRLNRLDKPEIVRGAGKSVEKAINLALPILEENGYVIISQATSAHEEYLLSRIPTAVIEFEAPSELLIAKNKDYVVPKNIGEVAIITGGTSDLPVAIQTKMVLNILGVHVTLYPDVGIAGLHRLFPVVKSTIESNATVVIAIAGQEGGLVPVLGGLIDIPIIGIPTSTGTGFGGEGMAALSTMLQSCSLGIAVVNIDNGIAGAMIAFAIVKK